MARDAAFRSWQSDRANHHRRAENISNDLGTAVNVQAMVFGNLGETSGTGVIPDAHPRRQYCLLKRIRQNQATPNRQCSSK
jgi:pyruvate,orthophosphate dikinase